MAKNSSENRDDKTPAADEPACVCGTICDEIKRQLHASDAKEIFDATMATVRKRPLLGVLVAAGVGYFLGRLSKKFF